MSGAGLVESAVTTFAWLAKAYVEGTTFIAPIAVMKDEGIIGVGNKPSAVMIDLSAKVYAGAGLMSVKELIVAQGISEADIDSLPRITKEQFYTLE